MCRRNRAQRYADTEHEYYKLNTIAHLMFHFGPAKISSSIKTIPNTGDVNHASVLKKTITFAFGIPCP